MGDDSNFRTIKKIILITFSANQLQYTELAYHQYSSQFNSLKRR